MDRLRSVPSALIVALCLVISGWLLLSQVRNGAYYPDFSVFWTAARTPAPHIYDSDYLTRHQLWLTHRIRGPRPWAYPPSALLLVKPFALLPFWPAFVAWNAVSVCAFVLTARRLLPLSLALFALVTPPVVFCVLSGQMALLLGAALVLAVTNLRERPILAGVVFGLIAAVKPQEVLLAPLAMAVGGHWRSLAAAALAGSAAALASFALGPALWLHWLSSLPDFVRSVDALHLWASSVSPAGAAKALDLPAWTEEVVQLLCLGAGGVLVVYGFRTQNTRLRLAALIIGDLFCTPYAMSYELAPLVVIAVAGLASGSGWGSIAALPAIGFLGGLTLPLSAPAYIRWLREDDQVGDVAGSPRWSGSGSGSPSPTNCSDTELMQ